MFFLLFLIITSNFQLLFPIYSAKASTFDPGYLLLDEDMTDIFSLDLTQIHAFLQQGSLGNYITEDIDGKRHYASDIIWRAAQRNGISPKVILTLLQKEQSLITDPHPSQNQLDFATGYGICDSCTFDDAQAQRFRGFAKQINSATLQLKEGYLLDLEKYGKTVMGYGPGVIANIDGQNVLIKNNATAALYTYTPHLQGNENFVKIWQQWFAPHYLTGSLLQNKIDGGIWRMEEGKKRPITSKAAYLSRYADQPLLLVDPNILNTYPDGHPIKFANYSLLKTENGTIYLLVDDTIEHIVSWETFRQLGFHSDEIIEVSENDLAGYSKGDPLKSDSAYPGGALLQDQETGGVYFVQNGIKYPLKSRFILNIRFPNHPILAVTRSELDLYKTNNALKLMDGTLIGVKGEPAIYVLSQGERHAISDANTFEQMGWKWEDIKWVDETTRDLHPLNPTTYSLSSISL